MRIVHRLVGQHGLADDVADGKDVQHVGAHLDVDVDEATVRDGHTGFIGADLLAVGRGAYGLQHQVVGLRFGYGHAPLCRCNGDLDAFGRSLGVDGFGFQ